MRLLDHYIAIARRLLPADFVAQFGEAMRETMELKAASVGLDLTPIRRSLARAWFWTREFADLGRTVLRERLRNATKNRGSDDRRSLRGGKDVLDDVRLAFRSMRRSPGFAMVVVTTLALGIGVNAAIFTVVDRMVLRALPYPDADRLVHLQAVESTSGAVGLAVAYADYEVLRDGTAALEAIGGYTTERWIHSGEGRTPKRIWTADVTNSFFDVMGVPPLLGRTFDAEEHRGDRQFFVMSHSFWEREYGSDPDVIGTSIIVNQRPLRVVGVMPSGFDYPFLTRMEGWMPMSEQAFVTNDSTSAFAARDWTSLGVIGRLAPGAGIDRASAEIESMSEALADAFPESNGTLRHHVVSLQSLETGELRKPMLLALGAVAAILLIACVNVASLLMARGAARAPELAVRLALGARRGRLIRLFLVESLLYALVGGALGMVIGAGLLRLLPLIGVTAPLLGHVSLDMRVLAVVGGVTILTGLAFGTLPAIRASGVSPGRALGNAGRSGRMGIPRAQRALVGVEIAASTVLTVGAGLLVGSLGHILSEEPGFDPRGVVTMRLSLPNRYMQQDAANPWAGSNAFFAEATSRLAAQPGVAAVGLSFTNPLEPAQSFNTRIQIPGWHERPTSEQPRVNLRPADPGFFEVFDIPLVSGRHISDEDRSDTEGVAVINEALARLIFGSENPLGHVVTGPNFWGGAGYPYPWRIVGVVGDVKSAGLNRPPAPAVYLPVTQAPMGNMRLVVRAAAHPDEVIPLVRAVIWEIDDQLPVDDLRTMEAEISRSVSVPRFAVLVVGIFALVAITLAAVGVYGVLSHSVGLRSGEFGVRQALGADRRKILHLVLGQGLRLAGFGIVAGLLVAALSSRVMSAFLYGVPPLDPVTYVVVSFILFTAAGLACLVPAVRATGVAPAVALRGE